MKKRVEYKKVGSQYRCLRCLCLCESENDVIEHLEYLHGVICDEGRHLKHIKEQLLKHKEGEPEGIGRIYKKHFIDGVKSTGRELRQKEVIEMMKNPLYQRERHKYIPPSFDEKNKEEWYLLPEKDRLYSKSSKSFCRKTSKKSTDRLFENIRKMKEEMKERGTKYVIPEKKDWVIFMGNLQSKDGVYVGYYMIYNEHRHKYEMFSSWGTRIMYYDEIASFCPVDIWKKYKEKMKRFDEEKAKDVFGDFKDVKVGW